MANKNISKDLGILTNIIDEKYNIEPTPTPNIYNKVVPVAKPTPPKGFVAPLTGEFIKPTPGPSPIKGELDPDTLKPLPPKGMEEDFGLYELMALPIQLIKEPFISAVKNQMKKVDDNALKQLKFYKNNPPKIDLKNEQIDIKMFVPEAQTSIKRNWVGDFKLPSATRGIGEKLETGFYNYPVKNMIKKDIKPFELEEFNIYTDPKLVYDFPPEFGSYAKKFAEQKLINGKHNIAILEVKEPAFPPMYKHFIMKDGEIPQVLSDLNGRPMTHIDYALENGLKLPKHIEIMYKAGDKEAPASYVNQWFNRQGYATAHIEKPYSNKPAVVRIVGQDPKEIEIFRIYLDKSSNSQDRELFMDMNKKKRVLNSNIAEPQAWDELKKLNIQPEGKRVPGFKVSGQSTKLDLPYPDYIPIWEEPYEYISNKITGFPSLHKSVGKIVEGKNNHAILPIKARSDIYPQFEHFIYKNGKLDVIKNELGKSEPHKLAAVKNGMQIAIDPRTKKILPYGEDLQHMWYEKNGYTTAYIPAPEYQRPGNPIVIIRGDNAKDINDMYMMLNKGIIDEADLVP